MKIVLISLCLSSLLYCNELQRIESIVKDIVKLRSDYEECQRSLGTGRNLRAQRLEKKVNDYKKLLEEEKQKNSALEKRLKNTKETIEYEKTIQKQNKKIDALNKEVEVLKKKLLKKNISVKKQIVKQKTKTEQRLKAKKRVSKEKLKIEFFKASTFKLKHDSSIYDYPNGTEIAKWEKDTTFTSNQKTSSYVKITGYFENKRWRSAKREMWIKATNVFKK